ncbi:MAG: hypothetical protein COB84_10605 [Rhodobacteraceae bacterium]|nr:MAG: hypothetical protein COB84_10605 [Paracoccaceae bacterium]
MADACCTLHEAANRLPKFQHGYSTEDLLRNGIYIVFEKGETAHDNHRIVRVGTHTGQNNLGKRIYEHLYKSNKDRSIFRKHIGRCLLAEDPFLEQWNLDATTKVNRIRYKDIINFERQEEVEKEVTQYIADNFSFVVFEVGDKDARLDVEAALLSTITACRVCSPSKNWLGLQHQNPRIRQGLWNIQGLNKRILSTNEMNSLIEQYF